MTCFCAVNEYQLLSGGGCREVALSALFIIAFYEVVGIFRGVFAKHGFREKSMTTVTGCLYGVDFIDCQSRIYICICYGKDGEYIESMGGNMTSLYPDMLAAHEFLSGEEFFYLYIGTRGA